MICSSTSGCLLSLSGLGGTAGLIRTMRANLLDELHKPYVMTARSKGLTNNTLIWKYPVRVALNPFVSGAGLQLPDLISGGTIVGVVLSLPTAGPLLLRALQSQDMYLAGAFVLLLSLLTDHRHPDLGYCPGLSGSAHPLWLEPVCGAQPVSAGFSLVSIAFICGAISTPGEVEYEH